MAITGGDRILWRELRKAGHIPERPTVLEIGKANWYGDVPAALMIQDFDEFGAGGEMPGSLDLWQAAEWWYKFMLRRPTMHAIDLDQAAIHRGAKRHDLNLPLKDMNDWKADIVINNGTGEHIFDQRQLWHSMHYACKSPVISVPNGEEVQGGLMVHAVPLWGWLDHGFYNYQPTFVADIAAENGYEILAWLFYEIKTGFAQWVKEPADFQELYPRAAQQSAMMHFAFRKTRPDAFVVPMQGVYSDRVTHKQAAAWKKRDTAKPMTYKEIQGWFDFENLYTWMVNNQKGPGKFVEVGAWLGKSTVFMADQIKHSGKGIAFKTVDTFEGTENEAEMGMLQNRIEDAGMTVYELFLKNVHLCNVGDYIQPLKMKSTEAAARFPDLSLDFVFLDADHSTEAVAADIKAWWPKVKPGGYLAGHDWNLPSVRAALRDEFGTAEPRADADDVDLPDTCWVRRK